MLCPLSAPLRLRQRDPDPPQPDGRRPRPRRIALLALSVLLAASSVSAQEFRGTIEGRVSDSSGAAVPGATVTITNTETNVPAVAITNDTGTYTVAFLNSGTYTVTVELEGFRKVERDGVEVRVGDRIGLDFTLEVGALQETVAVTATTPLLETRTASAGQVISEEQIALMPLSDGNPFVLTRLAPGIAYTGDLKFSRPFDNGGTSDITADGAPGANEFTLDGSPNMTTSRVAYVPPAGSVEEFKVQTATFDAQQGHTAGATINVTIKSGTNALRGEGYYHYRDEALSANDFFLEHAGEPKDQLEYDRYGFSGGGPVMLPGLYDGHSRTFFFGAAEWLYDQFPEPGPRTVPTEAQRNGDFSALLAQGIRIYDPETAFINADGRVERLPFPGNIVPDDRINSIGRAYLDYFPLPNQEGDGQGRNNYFSPNPRGDDFYSFLTRVDHQLTDTQKFFVRYARNNRKEYRGNWTGEVNGINPIGNFLFRKNDAINVDHVWTMSSRSLLNVRGGWSRFQEPSIRQHEGVFDPASLGFSPDATQHFGGAMYFPRFDLDEYDAIGEDLGGGTDNEIYSLQPVWTYMAGNHSVRSGYDFRIYRQDSSPGLHAAGRYDFSTCFTRQADNAPSAPIGQDLASLLLGLPCGGEIDRSADRFNQQLYHGFFVQDDWRVSNKLTVNLGLRYEYEAAPTERFNRNVRGFDPDAELAITAAAQSAYAANPIAEVAPGDFRVLGGLQFADDSIRQFYNPDRNNVQPRLGLAYQVNPKTVLRAGWAIYSVPLIFPGIFQPGFSQSTDIVSSLDDGLTIDATLDNPFPNGVEDPPGASLGPNTFLGRGIDDDGPYPLDVRNGQSMRWTAGLQRELGGQWVAEITYAANRGDDLTTTISLNPVPAQYLSTQTARDDAVISHLTERVDNPFAGLLPGTDVDGDTIERQQLLRAFPQFESVESRAFDGSSTYDSLQLRLERRFSNGFSMLTSYTWSQFLDKTWRMNETDAEPTEIPAGDDIPHRFVFNWVWELPVGRGRRFATDANPLVDALIGGWSVSGLYQWQIDRPIELEDDMYYDGDITQLDASYSTDNVDAPVFDTSGFYFQDEPVMTDGQVD
ncbi:MAG: TonB-dependent receptor domain-containing protein, partial [Vicinamibacteraceae bacterium]